MRHAGNQFGKGRFVAALIAALLLAPPHAAAAELKRETLAAFERYVRLREAQIDEELRRAQPFLRVDALAGPARREAYAEMRRGEVAIERFEVTEQGRRLDPPGGLIHHWVGTIFVPGASLDAVLALVQDYDNHANYFRPDVERSRVLARAGDDFRIYLRFYKKKAMITVVVNTEHDVHYARPAPGRAWSRSRTTRVAEVENPGKPNEREKPVGRDRGYLWHINTYWRFEEKDGGTYVECESISLTRDIPAAFAWLIKPFVTTVPKDSLMFTLGTTRARLAAPHATTTSP
jgi:hypothetical protein